MPANIYLKSLGLTTADQWFKLADNSLIVDATIFVQAAGAGPTGPSIYVRYQGGDAVKWPVATQMPFKGIDLAELEVCYCDIIANVTVLGQTSGY